MYYCAARYYDPMTQVFISLDPVRADGERSSYLYCNGDPINNSDPSGLKTLNMTLYNQGNAPTCLYVALRSVIKYVTQKYVNTKTLINQGFKHSGSDDYIKHDIVLLKKYYGIKSKKKTLRMSFSRVVKAIDQNRPIIALGSAKGIDDSFGGHAYNILGYKISNNTKYYYVGTWMEKRWRKVSELSSTKGTKWDALNTLRWDWYQPAGGAWYDFQR